MGKRSFLAYQTCQLFLVNSYSTKKFTNKNFIKTQNLQGVGFFASKNKKFPKKVNF